MNLPPPNVANYEEILRFVPDFVVVMDREGRVRYMNRVAEGFSLNDVIGADSTAFIDPQFRDLHLEVLRGVLQTGKPGEYELSVSPDPSEPEWYHAILSPIMEDGEVRFVVSVATNVTELKKAQEAREQAEERVEMLRQLVPLCAWCGRIRSDEGYWESVEEYLRSQPGMRLTHGICPNCAEDIEGQEAS